MPKGDKLTPKQETFVKAYVETQNASEAAMIAYDPLNRVTAGAIGAENLKKPQVIAAVDSLTRTMRETTSSALNAAIAKAKEMLGGSKADVEFASRFLLDCAKVYAESNEKSKLSQHLHVKEFNYPKR